MTDDLMKRSRGWLQACVNAATRSGTPEEADLEAFLLAHIDGEAARTQAACDRRAEEVREACALAVADHHVYPPGSQWSDEASLRDRCAEAVRATPLTATPLGDEVRALRARVAEHDAAVSGLTTAIADGSVERDALRAERDALQRKVEAVKKLCIAVTHGGATKAAWDVACTVLKTLDESSTSSSSTSS